jgi:DNA processing protein
MGRDSLLALALHRLPGTDGWLKRRILDSCRDTADLPVAIIEYSRARSSRARGALPDAETLLKTAELDLRRLEANDIRYRILGDADYPASLALIADPPLILFYRGKLPLDVKPPVALVGTRRPSAPAQRQAYRLGLEFALAGYPVVSGLAFGVDRAAHEGSLAACGTTWAVLASGLDRIGPLAHRPLAARILGKGGALVSEMPPGRFPEKYAFPRRNRILSGLCRGCVVVQAPAKSGALITADFALDQNRDLYVASAGLEGAASDGTTIAGTAGRSGSWTAPPTSWATGDGSWTYGLSTT